MDYILESMMLCVRVLFGAFCWVAGITLVVGFFYFVLGVWRDFKDPDRRRIS